MPPGGTLDAVVVGAGPNGLTAAVTLARSGLGVRVFEMAETVGGGTRTEELTRPGFRHDVCSAVHPLGAGSPVFAALPLAEHGLEWVHPDLPLAHPLPDGSAAVLARSVDETAASLGTGERAYRRLVGGMVGKWARLAPDLLRPVAGAPLRHPLLLARFGLPAVLSSRTLRRALPGLPARALLAGLAGHAAAPLDTPMTSGVGLALAVTAHEVGWPFAMGGSQAISDALASCLRSLGGEITTGHRVRTLDELPTARAYLLDTDPRDLAALAGERLSRRYLRRLRRYRHGLGVFKVDYALDAPVPWRADPCRRAGTVHLGGTYEEIATSLSAAAAGRAPDAPFVITTQPSLFDPSRAPAGSHVLWAYAHVPLGWDGDLTGPIERQLERFAPGFRDLVLARATSGPAEMEAHNPNLVGGDIAGGALGGRQALARPVAAAVPYATSDPAVFLCSSATPPGPGVHGMCGYHAARVAARRVFGITLEAS